MEIDTLKYRFLSVEADLVFFEVNEGYADLS